MDQTISFTVNGQRRSVITDPDRPLLEVLREDLHLTGTKYGCGEGDCRACTVLVDGRSTASCNLPVGQVDGRSVQTIESLADNGQLHPVQQAFLEENAFQCGYCTSGMIMETVALLSENTQPSEKVIRSHMERHLCRCCGYPNIVRAIRRAAELSRR